ncbi:RNA-binding protein NOB1 [Portunus trituberculatus]|uniref:RNA-binding protein NOB1 n=1 Tax=Portunus trituberculatus TaxID=210409 RepID=A0A5B7DCC4_PORTR|nr:RNA-binding protein NOB1 [Portunus trituberculatus]
MKPQYLVVDTAALVKYVPLWEYGEQLYSVPEIISEIRDKETRRRLEALPFPITMRQPQPHSIKFVNEFSKKTGDYASLSLADIKVLALTYELEVEVQGGNSHLNSEPHKILTEGAATKGRQREEFNDPPEQCEERLDPLRGTTPPLNTGAKASNTLMDRHLVALDTFLLDHSYITGYTPCTVDITLQQYVMKQYPQLCLESQSKCKPLDLYMREIFPLPLPKLFPHLSRWEEEKEVEKCALREDTETDDTQTHEGLELEPFGEEEGNCASQENGEDSDAAEKNGEESNEKEEDTDDDDDGGGWITCENIKKHKGKRNIFGTVEEEEEEDKDVQVACITGDFAMQNVLKHIGLSVMGVDGHLIKQLKTYILRCHACFRTTSAMDKIFCPHCGNKTLKKVSVTLDPDGTQRIWINTKRPINKKGMKASLHHCFIFPFPRQYSLPTPKGGKHARNPILVADQREAKKFSSKMSRKKINPLHEDYNPADQTPFAVRDVYSRAAQLGYIGGKNHHHFYWEKRNPNEPQRRTGKK